MKQGEGLTEEEQAEARDLFALFDKDCDGYVSISELGTMLRAFNLNPTEAEVAKLAQEADAKGSGTFDLPCFLELLAKRGKDAESIADLLNALKVLAEGDQASAIKVDKFKYFMANRGEPVSGSEVDEVLADFDIVHDEYINIEALAKVLFNK